MIYTDGIHLISDTSTEELHEFAKNINLGMEWFNDKKVPRYDMISQNISKRAQQAGAQKINERQYKALITQQKVKAVIT